MTPSTLLTPKPPHSDKPTYVWAVVILVLIGALLVMGILYLRPESDPLDVMGDVLKGLAPTIAAVLAFLKSQETHLSVNGRLDAFLAEHAKVARAEGIAQGVAEEQARVAAQGAPTPIPAPDAIVLHIPVES